MNGSRRVLCVLAVLTFAAIPLLAATDVVVVRLNAPVGIVVVEDLATYNAYQLTVTPQAASALKLGQKVSLEPRPKMLIAGETRVPISQTVNLDVRNLRVISVDLIQGTMKAEFVATGQVVDFKFTPELVKQREFKAGQTVAVGSLAKPAGLNGNCACGQRADGSCICVTWQDACCGPLMGPGCKCDPNRRRDVMPMW
jgi:hypothetical protein